jgi:hypothetical protein
MDIRIPESATTKRRFYSFLLVEKGGEKVTLTTIMNTS